MFPGQWSKANSAVLTWKIDVLMLSSFLCLKAKESESDPLINIESEGGILTEGAPRGTGWNSAKDLQA